MRLEELEEKIGEVFRKDIAGALSSTETLAAVTEEQVHVTSLSSSLTMRMKVCTSDEAPSATHELKSAIPGSDMHTAQEEPFSKYSKFQPHFIARWQKYDDK